MERTAKHFRKRDAILTCLRQTKVHPSAEWVFEQLKPEIPDLSLGTVYRNLALFKEQGLVRSLGTVNGVERFDGDTRSHIHFVCGHCGTVADLEGLPNLSGLQAAAEKDLGSRIDGCQITFTGTCRDCIHEKKEESA
ncbi:MAG: transcriptional repressor [Ruminococcaceae bacterium]|nr:transcriptional repressor [Oscillospiraceae bacterium]